MSGSNKFSRGGGRGINRMIPPPPLGRGMVPLRRGQPPGKEKGRPDESALKGRGTPMKGNSTGASSAAKNSQGESFELVPSQEQGVGPFYAMAIRLTPGMLETLKREEELGETASIKFGVNSSGHIIKVGEEVFRFSDFSESGPTCDIFEEQRRGEDLNGLLVEAGTVARKLSVLRTLNAADKATVKARSVEAERQQKSRKAIVLDHSNSLMNNKTATAGDANGRRAPVIIKGKKEPPQKKRKIVATAPVIPPPVAKTRPVPAMAERPPIPAVSAKAAKVSSPPEGLSMSSRPLSQGSSVPPSKPKGATSEEVGGSAKTVPATVSQKDKVSSPALAVGAETASKTVGVVNMSELRNCFITLLMDNPKGMSIKALEKALGEAMPNVRPDKKQIEKVIKAIAQYQAPGKYLLKDGVEKGNFAKPSPGSGSSPEIAPVDSPPLGDLPALTENVPERQNEIAGTVGNREDGSAALRQDPKRPDATSRNSSLPLRGGESAMNRAIRRAGEIVAEKKSGLDKSRTAVESSDHGPGDQTLQESTAVEETGDADDISIGGDESPVQGSPYPEEEGKLNVMEVENTDHNAASVTSPHLLDADKENADKSDSDSSSSSESESGSDSESESGSASASASDSDSDAASSSSEDVDVDIMSDDEDKPEALLSEAPKLKSKSKEVKASLEHQENRVQRQVSRGKKGQKRQKGSDAGTTPHVSEDADIGDGAEGGEMSKLLLDQRTVRASKGSDSEEHVDIVSCDEDTPSPPEQKISSPAESGEHYDNAIDPELVLHSDFMEDVQGGQDSGVHAAMPLRSGSDSDHSIEVYETRAETSGVRETLVKAIGDQKEDTVERKLDGTEGVLSPRSKGSSGTKLEEIPHSIDGESKTEAAGIALLPKGSDMADGPIINKEPPVSGSAFRADIKSRSLGTSPMPRECVDPVGPQMDRKSGPAKGKAVESKRKNELAHEIQGKGPLAHRGPQRFMKTRRPLGGMPLKGSDELLKPSEEPGLIGKGPEAREILTADRSVSTSQDGSTIQRPDVQRKQNNREAGLLGKPGKALEVNRGKPGRDPKQPKKPLGKLDGPKRDEARERAGVVSELSKDIEVQRRLPRDVEPWRKSPRTFETGSRIGSDNETHNSSRPKDLGPDQLEPVKTNVFRMSSDLELGELRDIVAGEDLRPKDSLRHEVSKSKESSDLPSRQPPNKARISPDKEKPKNVGRLGDIKRPSPAELKKQQLAKKEVPKADVPLSLRDPVRLPISSQKPGVGFDDRSEFGNSNRAVEVPKGHGDYNEKVPEGRNGKRPPEDLGHHDLGRPLKRTAFEQAQVAASLGRGEPDVTFHKPVLDASSKNPAVDVSRGVLADGGSQQAGHSIKALGDNGRVLGAKSKGQEATGDKEAVDKRGSGVDNKQKTTAGLLGAGSKKGNQSNGKKRSTQPVESQTKDFFAPYEKRAAELKGPISHYDQYVEYCNEYREKYPVYVRLNTVLESDKEDFEAFSRDITLAKQAEDRDKLDVLYGKVRKDYKQCVKRFKRMQKTFYILHDELRVIKQHCTDYAEMGKS